MSSNKEDYPQLPEGCPVEHPSLAESGVDNSDGSHMDVHLIPNRLVDWDKFTNANVKFFAKIIYSLMLKVGEPGLIAGEDPKQDTSFIPFDQNSTPDYGDPSQDNFESGKGGDPNLSHAVGPNRELFNNGTTHREAIRLIDRAIVEMAHRIGVPMPDPSNPGSGGNNFDQTFKSGETGEDGKGIGEIAPPSPSLYDINDSTTEAIAKIGYHLEQLFKVKLETHADNSMDDPVDWYVGKVHSDKVWDSQFTQDQIQRIIEDLGMGPIDYADFDMAKEIQVDPSRQKDYKVWSAARSAYEVNSLWKRTREALVRIAKLIAELGRGGDGGGIDPFDGKAQRMFSSKFETSLNVETNGNPVTVDFMNTILPGILPENRNKQVIVLNVASRPAKVGFWSRWIWAFVTGRMNQTNLDAMIAIGVWNGDSTGYGVAQPGGAWAAQGTYLSDRNPGLLGQTWDDFKATNMIDSTQDEYLSANWDLVKLDALTEGYGYASGDRIYWGVSGTTNTQAGPSWGTPVTQSPVTPVGPLKDITADMKKHMPRDGFTDINNKFIWDPDGSPRWDHRSVAGSAASTGNTYIESGKVTFAINVQVAGGYAKPYTLSETPFEVLYSIDTTIGEDLSELAFSEQEMQDYIIDGTELPTKVVPPNLIEKFSVDVKAAQAAGAGG